MEVGYHCPHLGHPEAPLSPAYASSSTSFYPLSRLYFCEECDAVRCDTCSAAEVASYYCPSCLFDVPSANVRADKNRCARSCFSCPQCRANLQVIAAGGDQDMPIATAGPSSTGPYLLSCPSCRWSSREIGWEFEKPSALALQVQKMKTPYDPALNEFEAIKDHLESYIQTPVAAPPPSTRPSSSRHQSSTTRNISHLTKMAAKALGKDMPGLTPTPKARPRMMMGSDHPRGPEEWDVLEERESKENWATGDNASPLKHMRGLSAASAQGQARLDKLWTRSWDGPHAASAVLPERIALRTKYTKRCPHPSCRHLLIQPDPKSTRMKIKMVAANYLPAIELGRRRRRVKDGADAMDLSPEELDRLRRERRRTRGAVREEEEAMSEGLVPGETYSFQLALTNPLFDPIQIRLAQTSRPDSERPTTSRVHIPVPHFTINALKDAWAQDDEDADDTGSRDPFDGATDATSENGSGAVSSTGSLARRASRARMSLSSTIGGGAKDRARWPVDGVERKANTSKVPVEIEVPPEAKGRVQFDLEVRFTYRADDPAPLGEAAAEGAVPAAGEEYKTFTFWVRVDAGKVAIEPRD